MSLMKPIAILVTGAPPPALRDRFDDYATCFTKLLGPPFETQVFDIQAGQWPRRAEDFSGVIVTGSAAGVYEDAVWIRDLLAWLTMARGRTRLVGICFGHQAMAQAFGGQVEKSDRGWGVGLHRYEIVSREPWMAPGTDSVAIPVSHQDQVVAIPDDARVIARSEFTPYGGLAYGDDAMSFQCHPEFDPAFVEALVDSRRGRIPDEVADAAVASLQEPDDRAVMSQWIQTFLGG